MAESGNERNCDSNAAVGSPRLLNRFWKLLITKPKAHDERINLRGWFVFFIFYMMLLATVVLAGLWVTGTGSGQWGTACSPGNP